MFMERIRVFMRFFIKILTKILLRNVKKINA